MRSIKLTICLSLFLTCQLLAQEVPDLELEDALMMAEINAPVAPPSESESRQSHREEQVLRAWQAFTSESVAFARQVSPQLGLSQKQVKSLGTIPSTDPLQLMIRIGFKGATDDSSAFYEQDEKAFENSLKNLQKAITSHDKYERDRLKKILDASQLARMDAMQFDHVVQFSPLRAMCLAGIDSSEAEKDAIVKLVTQPFYDRDLHRYKLINLISEMFPGDGARLEALRTGLTNPAFTRRSTLSGLLFFGAEHHTLGTTRLPADGTKCDVCRELFSPESTGYRLGRSCYHEGCFIRSVQSSKSKRGLKNPRRVAR